MISDKCRNDTSIMIPWRDAYAMYDMNAFMDTRAWKIISSYFRIWGRSVPFVQLRRWYGHIVPTFVTYHFMHCILHKSFLHHASASNMFLAHLLFSCSLMHDPCIFLCKTKKVTIKLEQCIIRIHPCFSLVALLIAFFPQNHNSCI